MLQLHHFHRLTPSLSGEITFFSSLLFTYEYIPCCDCCTLHTPYTSVGVRQDQSPNVLADLTLRFLKDVDAVFYILVHFNYHRSPSPCLLAAAAVALVAAAFGVAAVVAGESLVRGYMATTTAQVGGSERKIIFSSLCWKTLVDQSLFVCCRHRPAADFQNCV